MPSMWRSSEPSGPFLTRGAAAYPGDLNKHLAKCFVESARKRRREQAEQHAGNRGEPEAKRMKIVGRWRNSLVVEAAGSQSSAGAAGSSTTAESDRVVYTQPLRGSIPDPREEKRQEDERSLGGMRRAARAVAQLPSVITMGARVRNLMESFIAEYPETVDECCKAIGAEGGDLGPPDWKLEVLRWELAQVVGATSVDAVCENDCTSPIRAHLLKAWAQAARDPGAAAADWLLHGAPAGITQLPELEGVFPRSSGDVNEYLDPAELDYDADGFVNYKGIDEDQVVAEQIAKYRDLGYLQEFDSYERCRNYLGGEPVLSRFGLVVRTKMGKTKKRLILDVKQSQVKYSTRRTHRVPLPRGTDVAIDALESARELASEEALEFMVLDFKEAFWNVPLAKAERRFFVGRHRGKFYVFMRAAQGSRNGPLAWAGVISLVMRLTQGMFWDAGRCPVRLNTYVDDPLTVIRGTSPRRRALVALLVLTWRSLGLDLAFDKGALHESVDWIGQTVSAVPEGIELRVSAERVQELRGLTEEAMATNVVAVKWLRSYIGKANSFASVLVFWRPFLQDLWGALYAMDGASNAPVGCIWRTQIDIPLRWIAAFLDGVSGAMHRLYSLSTFCGLGPAVMMTFDASPWGAGGYLTIDGRPASWFATQFTEVDAEMLRTQFGGSESQQVAEAMAVLIGMRLWIEYWRDCKPSLAVRSDSVAALTMLARMKASGVGVGIVARELALTLAEASFRPQVCAHLPGLANKVADALSRRYEPGVRFSVPSFLHGVPEAQCPPREKAFFRTCAP